MNEHIINCPCCGEKLKIVFDDSGNPTVFLLEKYSISQEELSKKFGIEFGIVESEVKMKNER